MIDFEPMPRVSMGFMEPETLKNYANEISKRKLAESFPMLNRPTLENILRHAEMEAKYSYWQTKEILLEVRNEAAKLFNDMLAGNRAFTKGLLAIRCEPSSIAVICSTDQLKDIFSYPEGRFIPIRPEMFVKEH